MTSSRSRHVAAIDHKSFRAALEYVIIRFVDVFDVNGIHIDYILGIKKVWCFLFQVLDLCSPRSDRLITYYFLLLRIFHIKYFPSFISIFLSKWSLRRSK